MSDNQPEPVKKKKKKTKRKSRAKTNPKSAKKTKKRSKSNNAKKPKKEQKTPHTPPNPPGDLYFSDPGVSTSQSIRAQKNRLRKQLKSLEIAEKKILKENTKPKDETPTPIDFLPKALQFGSLSNLPDPIKYSLAFVLLSVMVFLCAMIIVSIGLALSPSETEPVTVENNLTKNKPVLYHTTTSTSSTSSTIQGATTSTDPPIVCNPPYMRLGLGCCLDKDSNNICDKDEAPPKSQTTTSTTESNYVRCSRDLDCGPTKIEYICMDNDVFKRTITHFCRNAKTKASSCETNVIEDLTSHCSPTEQCYIASDGVGFCKRKYTINNFGI